MTPPEVYRCILRYADALDAMADELANLNMCATIFEADRAAALVLAHDLIQERGRYNFPPGLTAALIGGMTSDKFHAVADVWRTWGEARRAELAACPVCEEAKVEAPGPMCADLHVEARA